MGDGSFRTKDKQDDLDRLFIRRGLDPAAGLLCV